MLDEKTLYSIFEKSKYSIFEKAKKYDELIKFPITIKEVSCSFCGKSQSSVSKLVAGNGVYVCDECINLCVEVLNKEDSKKESDD